MVYAPIVGRLDCESSSAEHLGFWQLDGYGLLAIYKSDWDRFGGKFNSESFSCTNTTSPLSTILTCGYSNKINTLLVKYANTEH